MAAGIMFSGQGAQKSGMFKDLYDNYGEVRNVFDTASKVLGKDIADICFNAPQEELNLTVNTQPCVLTCDIAAWEVLKNNMTADCFAGFSLGEYAALYAAGVLSMEDAFKIIGVRAEAMQNAVPAGEGMMAAVMTRDVNYIEECKKNLGLINVWVANYNTNGQYVISGLTEDVNILCDFMTSEGVVCKKLPVSAPFHCNLLENAALRLKELFETVEFKDAVVPVISNYDAVPETNGGILKEKAILQTVNAVKWIDTMNCMYQLGTNLFIECGPGRTLTGFVKKMKYEGVTLRNINSVSNL